MRNYLIVILFLLSSSLFAKQQFGSEVDMSKLVKISELLAHPDDYLGKMVTVSGMIVGVCKKRGCWMKFASDKQYQTLRIKVQDGKMVFPVSLRGHKGYATGIFKKIILPVKHAQKYLAHMAKEAGKEFDPTSVTKPYTLYQLVPTGVVVE